MLRGARAVAGKDLRDLGRERTLLVAILVQAFIAGFSTFLLVGLQGLYDPASVSSAAEVDIGYQGDGSFGRYVAGAPDMDLVVLPPGIDFQDADVDALVAEIESGDGVRHLTMHFREDDLQTPFLVSRLQVLLEEYEQDLRAQNQPRITHELLYLEPEPAPPYLFAFATLLPLLCLVPVFLSGAIAGDSFSQELQTGTITVLRSAPLSASAIVFGKMSLAIILAPAQAALWVGLMAANGYAASNIALLLTTVAIMAAILCAVAILTAVIVRREGATQAGYAFTALLLSAAALLLPRDPLNLLARIAVGPIDALTWQLVAGGAVVAVTLSALAGAVAARRLGSDG